MFTKLENPILEEHKQNDDFLEEIKQEELELSKDNRNLLKKKIVQEEMAKQAKIDDISIPVFDGENFSSWKFRFMNTLEYKECIDLAKRSRADQENEATWKKTDLKAKTILISALSDIQLEYVSECGTTLEMMTKLDKMYSTKSTSLQIINRSKLEDVKLKNFNNIEKFFVEFENACNELKAAGATLKEEEKMRYLIKALPPSYCYIGDFIDLVP